MAEQQADLTRVVQELERAQGIIQGVASDPAMVARIASLASLLSRRVAAGNFNCCCGAAQIAGEYRAQ